jgi:thymidylate synthase
MEIWIIVALTCEYGIGFQNKIPWYYKEDLQHFKRMTIGNAVIMGRKTYESIGRPLQSRHNIVVSSVDIDGVKTVRTIEDGVAYAQSLNVKYLWVCGGATIYDYFMYNYTIDGFSITEIPYHECDTFIKSDISEYLINYKKQFKTKMRGNDIIIRMYSRENITYRTVDDDYLDLIARIMENGETRETRNGETLSVFSEKISVDLRKGFPLLTTKKMFYNGIIHELLWFIKGNTDSRILEEKGVKIWSGNTSKEFLEANGLPYEEGIGGPIYGYMWRRFGEKYKYRVGAEEKETVGLEKGSDQLKNIVDEIRKNPTSRRLFMSAWNPCQLSQMCLPPCHVSYQFYVRNGELECQMYQRSADVFLGLPFNIASVALLTHLIASVCGLGVGNIHVVIGDAHIYKEHLDAVKTQLGRRNERYLLPSLRLRRKAQEVWDYNFEDIEIVDYESAPAIKARMLC